MLVSKQPYTSEFVGRYSLPVSRCSVVPVAFVNHASEVAPTNSENPTCAGPDAMILARMYTQSTSVLRQRVELCESAIAKRRECIDKMQTINHMHNLRCGRSVVSVQESTVMQGILLLDWMIDNEFTYFMEMDVDLLSGVCIILSVCDVDSVSVRASHQRARGGARSSLVASSTLREKMMTSVDWWRICAME